MSMDHSPQSGLKKKKHPPISQSADEDRFTRLKVE